FIGGDAQNGDGVTRRHAISLARMRGLYPSFAGRKEELQKWRHALRPRGFVVLRAFHALVVQVAARPPTLAKKNVAKTLYVFDGPPTLARSNIQPHARQRVHGSGVRKAQNHSLVPPYRRRKRRDFPKHVRKTQPQIQRYQPAERRASNPRVFRSG